MSDVSPLQRYSGRIGTKADKSTVLAVPKGRPMAAYYSMFGSNNRQRWRGLLGYFVPDILF
jgi:hypothetical protein